MPDPLAPSAALLCKLGSIITHFEELNSTDGHQFDMHALQSLLTDPEFIEWKQQMEDMALIPKKRTNAVFQVSPIPTAAKKAEVVVKKLKKRK